MRPRRRPRCCRRTISWMRAMLGGSSNARARVFLFDRARAAALREMRRAGKEGISSLKHRCQSAFMGSGPERTPGSRRASLRRAPLPRAPCARPPARSQAPGGMDYSAQPAARAGARCRWPDASGQTRNGYMRDSNLRNSYTRDGLMLLYISIYICQRPWPWPAAGAGAAFSGRATASTGTRRCWREASSTTSVNATWSPGAICPARSISMTW